MTLKSGAKFEEKPFFFKNDKNLVNFDPSTKKLMISALINLHFDWSLLCKVYNV